MKNEEKAKEIVQKFIPNDVYDTAMTYIMAKQALLQMAQWKDEQFDEEKKELLGLVNMLSVDEHNQTIIEDLKALLQ